jgi:hypothetical protein
MRRKKGFSKTACGWHDLGYVEVALENGRSVFPIERRSDGLANNVCTPARFLLRKKLAARGESQ